MTEVQLWQAVTTFVQAGGTTAILIAIVLMFLLGRLVTGSAYDAERTDKREWIVAYKAVAEAALRLQQEIAAARKREDV